ncbi:ornithine aminomutase subunit alpha [Oceanotoga sp. DSM 15011]|jgi:D-ornithine 4,5-aminomutase subunit alpha|uniref:D-ornithine 4,5-aminomutase S subunit n=1 Tax=Oceanotoga teriensis TaxID=515440 RepID=A0AA45HID2_9BACT|nr:MULTISPECIES: ornithine aminomutase subunit alpha [Oceanotoga]MDN5343771.1 D-ornithine 4,5-aminomutase subunit alpha [Oceanotoga sp.]PWJ92032.1 D-ornithine 4,5-aminomutase S subunit [Oceanotoga teriensis]UYO99016.1 ornithine aminomutase subunit alpha [Oceanotoga sp. DSM 15011]
MEARRDDFEIRAKKLNNMSDEELDKYFWDLTEKVVDPMIEMAKKNTSQSIERSVLLRMGFNSMQATSLVSKIFEKNLLSKGAGHIIWRIAKEKGIDVIKAGRDMIDGKYWDDVDRIFKRGEN